MIKAKDNLRVILIGGSSHSGKSTIAKKIAEKIEWSFLSTDSLARHPGRPWKPNPKDIPVHVVEHYSTLSVDELIEDVLHHYRGVWSNIKDIIALYVSDSSCGGLIIEGSALWPEFVTSHNATSVKSIWLTAENDQFQERIYRESNYEWVTDVEKLLIDKFLLRTQSFNERMMAVINQRNLMSLPVSDEFTLNEIADICLKTLMG
jgi:2-phosphoglycerate kinase